MADIKWIKVAVDMFEDDRLFYLSTYRDGDALIIQWIKLLCASGKTNDYGRVAFELLENFDSQNIEVFQSLGLVSRKGDEIYIADWKRFIKVDRECVVNDGNYEDLRRLVFERDDFTCVYCGDTNGPFEADHVHPKSRGGLDALENLVCACRTCNRSKKDKTPEEWGMRYGTKTHD